MNRHEAADIIATVELTSPEYATLEPEDRVVLIADYLEGVRGQHEIIAKVNAYEVLKLAPSAGEDLEAGDIIAVSDGVAVKANAEEPDPLANSLVIARDWAYDKADPEDDPLADPPLSELTTSKAGKAVERIAAGKRRLKDNDGRLKKGIEVPGLLDAWLKASNLSDSEAAVVLNIAERMTVYNMRNGKQRQVLTKAQLKAISADVSRRMSGFRGILALLKQYEA